MHIFRSMFKKHLSTNIAYFICHLEKYLEYVISRPESHAAVCTQQALLLTISNTSSHLVAVSTAEGFWNKRSYTLLTQKNYFPTLEAIPQYLNTKLKLWHYTAIKQPFATQSMTSCLHKQFLSIWKLKLRQDSLAKELKVTSDILLDNKQWSFTILLHGWEHWATSSLIQTRNHYNENNNGHW